MRALFSIAASLLLCINSCCAKHVIASSNLVDPSSVQRRVGVLEGCTEVALSTLASFTSGAILGYVIGFAMGAGQKGIIGADFSKLVGAMHSKGQQTALMWGSTTACFSGFTSASKFVRARDDGWNQVIGSCGTGAFLARNSGFPAMVQGAASYGIFAYLLEKLMVKQPNALLPIMNEISMNDAATKSGQASKRKRLSMY